MARKGLLIVLSGPSGVGKEQYVQLIFAKGNQNLCTQYLQRLVSQDQVKWMERLFLQI